MTKKPNFARKGPDVEIATEAEFWRLIDECKGETSFRALQPKLIAFIYKTWRAPGNQGWAEGITRRMWENPTSPFWVRRDATMSD